MNLTAAASVNETLEAEIQSYVSTILRDFAPLLNLSPNNSLYPALLLPALAPSTEFKLATPKLTISSSIIVFAGSLIDFTQASDIQKLRYIGLSLYFCTKSLSTIVKDGVANTTELAYANNILSSDYNETLNWIWSSDALKTEFCPSSLVNSSIVLSSPTGLANETYSINVCTGLQFSNLFTVSTEGGVLLYPDLTIHLLEGQLSFALGLALYGPYGFPPTLDQVTQFQNINSMISNIAASLTNSYVWSGFPDPLSTDTTQ